MADLYYIEEGYYDIGYYVYTADASAAVSSEFALGCEAIAIVAATEAAAALSSEFTITCNATAIGAATEASADLTSTTTLSSTGGIGKESQASLTSPATLDITATRIQEASAAFTSAFAPSLSVEVFKNSFAVLDVPTVLSALTEVNRSITQTLDTIASLNAMAEKTVGITSDITASFTQTVSTSTSVPSSASLESTSSLAINAGKLELTSSNLVSASSMVTLTRILTRNTQLTANTGGRYSTVEPSSAQSKFGGKSLVISGYSSIRPTANNRAVWNGTDFKIIDYGYTWTSSDGLTWTRATNNLTDSGVLFKWNGSAYYGIGSNKLYTSTNGTSITSNTPSVDTYSIGAVEHKSGYYYLATYISTRYQIWRSTTPGGTWTSLVNIGTAGFTVEAQSTAQDGTNVIFLFTGSGTTRAVSSSNGTTWNSTLATGAYVARQIAFGNGKYAIVSGSSVLTSTSVGGTFTLLQTLDSTIQDIEYDNSKWIVSTSKGLYTGTDLVNSSSLTSVKIYDTDDAYDYYSYNGIEYGAGRWLLSNQARTLSSTDGSNWNYNDIEDVFLPGSVVYNRTGSNTDFNDWKTLDFWFYTNNTGVTSILRQTGSITSSGSDWWRILALNSKITFAVNSSGTNTSITTSTNLTGNAWNHVRIVRNAGSASIYLNGSRAATGTAVALPTSSNPVIIGSLFLDSSQYLDELLLSDALLTDPSATSITVPTAPYTNSTNVDLLLHFDSDAQDDARYPVVEQAALTATFSVSAQTSEIQNSSAALTATSTQTATANITGSAVGDLTTAVSVTAIVERVQESGATLDATCTLSATSTKISSTAQAAIDCTASLTASLSITRAAFGDLSAASTQSLDYTRTRQAGSNLSSAFAPTLSVTAQRAGVALLESVTALSLDVAKITGFTSDISSSTTVEVNAGRLIANSSQMASESALAIDYLHLVGQSVAVLSEFTISTEAARTRQVSSTQVSISTVSAQLSRTRDLASSLTAAVTMSATALRIQAGSADLASTATSTSTAVKTATVTSTMAAEATQITVAVKTTDVVGNFTAIAIELTAAFKNATGTISMESSATLSMLIGRRIELLPNQNFGISSGVGTPALLKLSGLPQFGFGWNDPGFTVSVWARRKTTNTFSVIWSYRNDPSAGLALHALVFDNNNVRLRNNYDADEPGATWNNQAPVDTEWHHYLLQCSRQYGYWKLWIDGVYKGEESHQAYMEGASWNNNRYIEFGGGYFDWAQGSQYDEATTLEPNLDFAQIWAGIVPTYQPADGIIRVRPTFNPQEFYNGGYVELGENGRGEFNQLPAPYIYNRLSGAYTYIDANGSVSPVISAAEIALEIPTAPAQFNLTLVSNIVQVLTANLTSTTSLTAQSNYRFDPSLSLSSAFTESATASRTRTLASALSSNFTQSATAFKTRTVAADLASTSTVQAEIGYVKPLAAGLSTEFTVTCEPTEIVAVQGSASLSSEFTVTAIVNERQGFTSTPSSEFTVTCDATVKPPIRITADLTAAFTVTAELVRVQAAFITLSSEFTQTADVTKIKGVIANLSSQSTVNLLAGLQLQGAALLQVQAFELTQGDILNFAPELTLYVKGETRVRRVLPENRLYDIDSESRTRRVLPESRIITIEQQTEVNII